MDPYSSGEELVIKTRKPYTITKQRERWTEEEHNRFLEALKLYGRAWQRIEEHIGTKTAVQIRSHAQKFFTKLEKEALTKGVPISQALDIEIPPPRPKRKPVNPYPRKTVAGTPTLNVGSKDGKSTAPDSSVCQTPIQEKELILEKPGDKEKLDIMKENRKEMISDVLTLYHEGPTSPSLGNRDSLPTEVVRPQTSCTFREFVPTVKGDADQVGANKSHLTAESKGNQEPDKQDTKHSFQDASSCNSPDMERTFLTKEKLSNGENFDKPNQPEGIFEENDMQGVQSCPRHVPVHILDGMNGHNTQDMSYHETIVHQMNGIQGNLNQFAHHASSNTSENQSNPSRPSMHQMFPSFHPIMASNCDSNDYRSCLHLSSTFSSLIVSALLQNPAAHAAASFAASFWPYANFEPPADSSTSSTCGVPPRPINSVPSMAAIAAATVAAATAWWAAHGLLPLCSPFHSGFTCPTSSATVMTTDACQTKVADIERKDGTADPSLHVQPPVPGCSETLQEQLSASKSPVLSPSDSEESDGMKLNTTVAITDTEQAAMVTEVVDSNTAKNRKQVDRSSCGSNTPSSSEVETDALEKVENDNKDSKEPHVNHTTPTDSGNRRGKSSCNSNDSWKEVSEGGRIAFQALFSREVLPQSFSPPHDLLNSKGKKNSEKSKLRDEQNEEERNGFQLDLNEKSSITCSIHDGINDKVLSIGDGNSNQNHTLTIRLGEAAKLKARRTGFKPYKRCSMEVKESRIASTGCQDEEKGPKRLRVGAEAST